ncbi:MAG: AGE family epimerase/isomerase [Maribacter sp.]|nr:AGE family epimerase/isomerase [Maribacter sp.]
MKLFPPNNTMPGYWLFLVVLLLVSCKQKAKVADLSQEELLPTIEIALHDLATDWYPKALDTVYGGYWSDFNYKWDKVGKQDKMIVSQARHIWTASQLALFYKDERYVKIAAHGYHFLRDQMWDSLNGGFNTLMGIEGTNLKRLSTNKSTYGNAFAIYALATYSQISKDTAALELAKKTFYWLEEHAHDPVYKGYFDVLQQDGAWMLDVTDNDNHYDNFIRKDWKDQNSSIHLLESFTALYGAWPDPLVRERLEELFYLIRDTITTEKGYLTLHLQRDWTPVSLRDSSEVYRKQNFYLDHVSFGHDVETAFLLLEASHAMGLQHDTITARKAKKMVDHALEWGWDSQKGGFYDGGYYQDEDSRTIENKEKVWWAEAEGLNSLLLLSQLYPQEARYYDLFKKQWAYIDTYLIDHEYGGWYEAGLDISPEAKKRPKAQIWKANYHDGRSMMNVIRMLKGEFPLTESHKRD